MPRVNPRTVMKNLIEHDLAVNRQIVEQILWTRLGDGYTREERKSRPIGPWQKKIRRLADRWIARLGLQRRWRSKRKDGK